MSHTKSHSPRSQTRSTISLQMTRMPVLVLGDPLRREPVVHERPPPLVQRVVHADHHGERLAVRSRRLVAREPLGVLLDGQDVLVLGDGPDVALRVVVDGRVLAHPRPVVVGLGRVPVTVEQIDVVAEGVVRHARQYCRDRDRPRRCCIRWSSTRTVARGSHEQSRRLRGVRLRQPLLRGDRRVHPVRRARHGRAAPCSGPRSTASSVCSSAAR